MVNQGYVAAHTRLLTIYGYPAVAASKTCLVCWTSRHNINNQGATLSRLEVHLDAPLRN
jgi:hypothetical protein